MGCCTGYPVCNSPFWWPCQTQENGDNNHKSRIYKLDKNSSISSTLDFVQVCLSFSNAILT